MKKFMMALVAIATIAFVGCSKDDKDNVNIVGTIWSCTEVSGGDKEVWRLTFTDARAVSFDYQYYEYNQLVDSERSVGTYVYTAPQISINLGGDVMVGTVSGKTLTLGDGYGMTLVFKKE